MQHIKRRRHKQASVHLCLELACKPITGSRFANIVEQLSIFVQKIHTLEILLLDFFIESKGFFFKTVKEEFLDAFKAFLGIGTIRLSELIYRADPFNSRRMGHRHAMSVRNLFSREQVFFQELGTAAVCIVRKREILNAIEVCGTGKRILAHFHIRIAQEHSRGASAPEERILRCITEVSGGLYPHATLKVAVAYAESRPLALEIALETLMDEFLVAVNRLVVHQLLFKFKTAQPKVVRIFVTELAHILQKGIVHVDFFVKNACGFLAIKLEDGLDPGRTRFHIFNQIAVLFNRIFVTVQRTECSSTLFPQHNAGVQIQRALL